MLIPRLQYRFKCFHTYRYIHKPDSDVRSKDPRTLWQIWVTEDHSVLILDVVLDPRENENNFVLMSESALYLRMISHCGPRLPIRFPLSGNTFFFDHAHPTKMHIFLGGHDYADCQVNHGIHLNQTISLSRKGNPKIIQGLTTATFSCVWLWKCLTKW